MRSIEEMKEEFHLLGQILDKYLRVEKLPHDFGVGIELHSAEIHTVSTICIHGEISITDLARRAGITKGAVSQVITKLEKKGLVYKRTAPDNLSKSLVGPTELGRQAQKEHINFHMRHDKDLINHLANLPDNEFRVIQRLLKTMDKWMDTYLR